MFKHTTKTRVGPTRESNGADVPGLQRAVTAEQKSLTSSECAGTGPGINCAAIPSDITSRQITTTYGFANDVSVTQKFNAIHIDWTRNITSGLGDAVANLAPLTDTFNYDDPVGISNDYGFGSEGENYDLKADSFLLPAGFTVNHGGATLYSSGP
jgi:hypothetical protein